MRETIERVQKDLSQALLKMKDGPGHPAYLHIVDAQCSLTEMLIYLSALDAIAAASGEQKPLRKVAVLVKPAAPRLAEVEEEKPKGGAA